MEVLSTVAVIGVISLLRAGNGPGVYETLSTDLRWPLTLDAPLFNGNCVAGRR